MSIKRHLTAKIRRTRGGHAMPNLVKAVEDMDEATAQSLWTLIQNIEADAKQGARKRWQQPGIY